MYSEEGAKLTSLKKLPATLLDALCLLEKSRDAKKMLGKELVTSYVTLKKDEWRRYTQHLSQWELDNTLDC